VARSIEDPGWRSRALAGVAGRLGPAEAEDALGEALAAARAVESGRARDQALSEIADHAGPERALAVARQIADPGLRALTLAALGQRTPATWQPILHEEALQAARSVPDQDGRAAALVALSAFMTVPREDAPQPRSVPGDGGPAGPVRLPFDEEPAPPGKSLEIDYSLAAQADDAGRQPVPFPSNRRGEQIHSWLDCSRQHLSWQSTTKDRSAGTLLFIGFHANTELIRERFGMTRDRPHGCVPTPLNWHLLALLAETDNLSRAYGLARLAERLSESGLREGLLKEALRRRDQAERPGAAPSGPPAHLIPWSDVVWGRFAMLRPDPDGDGTQVLTYVSMREYLARRYNHWVPFFKEIHLAGEVEADPDLLEASIREAVEFESSSRGLWRQWLQSRLESSEALRERMLGLL
jgi:hypothetical protein